MSKDITIEGREEVRQIITNYVNGVAVKESVTSAIVDKVTGDVLRVLAPVMRDAAEIAANATLAPLNVSKLAVAEQLKLDDAVAAAAVISP